MKKSLNCYDKIKLYLVYSEEQTFSGNVFFCSCPDLVCSRFWFWEKKIRMGAACDRRDTTENRLSFSSSTSLLISEKKWFSFYSNFLNKMCIISLSVSLLAHKEIILQLRTRNICNFDQIIFFPNFSVRIFCRFDPNVIIRTSAGWPGVTWGHLGVTGSQQHIIPAFWSGSWFCSLTRTSTRTPSLWIWFLIACLSRKWSPHLAGKRLQVFSRGSKLRSGGQVWPMEGSQTQTTEQNL